MQERLAIHHPSQITWIVVADSKSAQIYQYDKSDKVIPIGEHSHHFFEEKHGYVLVPVPDGALKPETMDDYQISHAGRGSGIGFGSSTPNSYEPQGNIKEELRRRLTKNIAAQLEKAHAAKSFQRLVLAAPAKLIGELRKQLPPAVQECVAAVLPRDLTRYEPPALLAHLQDTLAQANIN